MNTQRKETKYYKPVGIKDGSIYFLDYTFDDGDFKIKGATGTVFDAITQDQIDDYNDEDFIKDTYKDCWVESVKAGKTEQSLSDYIDDIINYCDGEYPHQDCSYSHLWDEAHKHFDDSIVTFNCAGGGRCFDKELLNSFDKVIDPELIKIIKQYEDIKEAA